MFVLKMEINASLPETSMLILFLYKAPFPSTKAIPLAVYVLIDLEVIQPLWASHFYL